MSKGTCVCIEEGHHSSDLLRVFHGRSAPTYICGYHEQRYGVPSGGTTSEGDSMKSWEMLTEKELSHLETNTNVSAAWFRTLIRQARAALTLAKEKEENERE